jgi:hypothetical protein
MLGRVMNVIFGCMFLAAGGYMLFLHLASGEALRSFILLMGGALLAGGVTCLWAGLRPRR